MLLPLVTLIFSLAKILPPTYTWHVENRIYRWYKILHGIEVEASSASQTSEVAALKEKIEKVEVDLINVRVPLSVKKKIATRWQKYNFNLRRRLIDLFLFSLFGGVLRVLLNNRQWFWELAVCPLRKAD